MKRFILLLLLIVVSMSSAFAQEYSAMTYNIRYSTERDGVNWWEYRKAWLTDQVLEFSPDVLGIQEGLHEQVTYLDSALSNYDYVGVGRDDGKKGGEYTALFYRSDRLEMMESGTFWLSETPDTVSVGWDAALPRVSTFARFKVKNNGKEFWVFNAHLDHMGAESRLNAVKLIVQKAYEFNKRQFPVIIMGDLNARPEDPPIVYLQSVLNDSRELSVNSPQGPIGTFNGFDTRHPLDARIDYIFVNDQVQVQEYHVINEIKEQRTPSDHLPVFIRFIF